MRAALSATASFALVAVALLGALPLWLDETLQLIETRDPSTTQMIARLPRNSGAAPLGYLVQHYSLGLTGYSIRKARLPAALFGIATVLAVGLLAAEAGVRYSWLAAALFAFFPESLRYATESRVYSQALFFSVLATLIYVTLAKRPTAGLAAGYWLALTLAICTQPYAASVGLALLLWSVVRREIKAALYGGVAFALAILAFLPWYLWSRAAWAAGIAREGFHFSFSARTLLMLFREVAGAGYWGSALLLILCAIAVARRYPHTRAQQLLICLLAVPVVCVLAGDAVAGYFVAARQFIWILPAIAILAAMAIERRARTAMVLYALLGIVCVRQSVRYFTAPHENWQAAASFISDQVQRGACLIVSPSDHARLYEFFRPELERARCIAPRMVLAITPVTNSQQRQSAIASLIAQGYTEQDETVVGKSAILFFQRSP
jgi:4-amino-4-deoxy-L-arabinose transferase-like glycosyltransferase